MMQELFEHFGFKFFPFGKDATDLFDYPQFTEIRHLLEIALQDRSISLVSGQAGVGKTTGVRSFVDTLPSNAYAVLYLGHDQQGTTLLRRLCLLLGLKAKPHRSQLILQIGQFLEENLLESGKSIYLIVDECHLLDLPTLEDLRLLTNADFDRSSPLTLTLIGQLSFRRQLKAPGYEAINQRIRFRYALEGLSLDETIAYIKHRLTAAAGQEDIFLPDALKIMFASSGGIPREVNNLCSAALLKAFAIGAKKVDAKLVKLILDMREVN
jgi:type II secretory pathway predicted ATPase ExeA